jgi:CHASE3 domain sensor protein
VYKKIHRTHNFINAKVAGSGGIAHMGWLRNITVQNRLLGAFIIISVVGVLTAAWNIYNVIQMDDEVEDISKQFTELTDIEEAQVNLLRQELTSKNFLLTDRNYYLHKYDEYDSLADYYLRHGLMYAGTPAEIDAINKLGKEISTYHTFHEQVIEAYDNGNPDEALRLMTEQVDAEVERIHEDVEAILRTRRSEMTMIVEHIDGRVQVSILMGVFSLGIFSVLALLASTTTGQIAEPILHLTNAVVAFETGAYKPGMLQDIMRRKDEIGQLASAFDRMAASIEDSNRSKDQMLDASRRFVPYEYLDFLQRRNITEIRLGDHVSAEMAVMFSDIRSFTTISERMTPQENFDFVNVYLSRVSPVIKNHDGIHCQVPRRWDDGDLPLWG